MSPYLNPNLEIRCLVALAIALCNYKKVEKLFLEEMRYRDPEDWEEVAHESVLIPLTENDMKRLFCEKWPKTDTTQWSMGDKLLAMLANIYREIIKFFVKNAILVWRRVNIDFNELFVFDPIGTLNHHKTIENILKSDIISNRLRFTIACSKCLKDHVFSIWNKMEHAERRFFDRIDGTMDRYRTELTYMWIRVIHEEGAKTDSFPNDNFYKFCKTPEAMMYTLQYELPERRSSCLDLCIENSLRRQDDLPFWLQHMNAQEKNVIYKRYAFEILKYCLYWPLVLDFMDMARILYSHLTPQNFVDFFRFLWKWRMTSRHRSHRYFYYRKLYAQFFQCAPTHLKDYVKQNIDECDIIETVKSCLKSNT
ncbi:hypothetical protein AVEN_194489-1 [Araneus ventricosus]|uniref:Uncharacterized protein n=1 Tax=Araneus ventricosus TaxID=182803 RepID=A0A4Y2A6F2_ARAVE|nr:hypothetical protein AVEN_194489-1 [Araneus ventricosus]